MHHQQVRPFPPLPLYRSDTIVQHYMQPEQFTQFHRNACADGEAVRSADAERDERIAAVYDTFVRAEVMRR